jgi:hypothetical protein
MRFARHNSILLFLSACNVPSGLGAGAFTSSVCILIIHSDRMELVWNLQSNLIHIESISGGSGASIVAARPQILVAGKLPWGYP